MAEYIKKVSLNEGRKVFNDTLTDFQTQIDQIVVEGDSSVEAAQARVDINSNIYDTLKARLDTEQQEVSQLSQTVSDNHDEVTSHLAEKANQSDLENEMKVRSTPQYGEIKLPDDFIDVGFKLYRNGDGLIEHGINLSQYKSYGTTLYVKDDGDNAIGDGSESNPYRTVHKALIEAINGSDDKYRILVYNEDIIRNEFSSESTRQYIDNKQISIINMTSKDYIVHTEGETSGREAEKIDGTQISRLTWTLDQNDTYYTTRSSVSYVTDKADKDFTTDTIRNMKEVLNLTDCRNTKGSYFIDGSSVYVHTINDRQPDENINLILSTNAIKFGIQNGGKLYIEGFYFNSAIGLDIIDVNGDGNSKFIQNNVKIGRTNTDNGLTIDSVGTVISINTLIHDAFKDCFNYHYYQVPSSEIRNFLAVEINCRGFRAGLNRDTENNNVSTMHEGANVLRVNTIGDNTKGTPCSDINGSYSVLLDCHMKGSIATGNMNNGYYFYTDSNKSSLGAKVYMENCSGHGENSVVNTDEGTILTLKSYHNGLDKIKSSGTLVIAE